MAFATRSKFFWSRFIATCVKYLGVANTQHIRYIAEKLFPTEMSRQNILYHVRIAEEKGWIATFSSSLEITAENEIIFRKNFLLAINEKISAQRFIIIGTESFELASESRIIDVCTEVKLGSISITDSKILTIVTQESIKRLSSTKEKAIGNRSLFMVLILLKDCQKNGLMSSGKINFQLMGFCPFVMNGLSYMLECLTRLYQSLYLFIKIQLISCISIVICILQQSLYLIIWATE